MAYIFQNKKTVHKSRRESSFIPLSPELSIAPGTEMGLEEDDWVDGGGVEEGGWVGRWMDG